MRNIGDKFSEEIIKKLTTIADGQEEALHQAAIIIADTVEKGGIVQSFGSGHSYGNALEISGRAGGFIQTKIINEPSRGNYEMVEGVGTQFLNHWDLRENDCLILISNSGRNPLSIEMAMGAKALGIKIIVVTALQVAKNSTSRHSSGKMLHDFADVILDNKSIFGDSCIEVEGLPVKVGGTSLYTGSMLLDRATFEAIDILLDRGVTPPLFMSANVDGGPEFNKKYQDMYKDRLRLY
ncbi:MAG: SIS domain-containing protein [Erysipelotrichaceae bacterium]